MKKSFSFLLLLIMFLFSACTPQQTLTTLHTEKESLQVTNAVKTPTPFQPIANEVTQDSDIKLWIPEYLAGLQIQWKGNSKIVFSTKEVGSDCSFFTGNGGEMVGNFIYAFVVPFNSIQDDITVEKLTNILFRESTNQPLEEKIFLSKSTYSVISESLGDLSKNVIIVEEEKIFSSVSQSSENYGLIRFDHLEPKWKVLGIGNISPYDQNFDQENYYLNFPIRLNCSQSELVNIILDDLEEKFTTRDTDKLTSVLLTGTTALTRATADRMEKNGILYPGENIKSWFENSDIRHISSETPFMMIAHLQTQSKRIWCSVLIQNMWNCSLLCTLMSSN